MWKGHFITAYLQREIPLELAVVGNLRVGQLVTLTPSDGTNPAKIAAAAGASAEAVLAAATHIVAQSDMTLGYGHIPVENRDYKYNDAVAATSSATTTKHVALYAINDKNDIIVQEV